MICDALLSVRKELGTTIVFVTHDIDEALRVADRIVVMNAGTIVQNDVPDALLANPASNIVRGLIGIDARSRAFAEARPLLARESA